MFNYVYKRMLQLNDFQPATSHAAAITYMKSTIWLVAALCVLAVVLAAAARPGAATSAVMAVALPAFAGIVRMRALDKLLQERKTRIVLELPVFVNKLMLLINAGETLQRATIRCAEQYTLNSDHPLARLLQAAAAQLNNHYPLPHVFDEFSRRCGVHEAAMLASALMMNYRRGGPDFASALRQLSVQLWHKRKAEIRTLGEEASARLVFPLVIIFFLLMVVVAAPAIMAVR